MKIFSLLFICFMLCGCRTFTDLEFNQHLEYAYDVGYKDGHKEGYINGTLLGNIQCLGSSFDECQNYFDTNMTILENFLETRNHQ